MEDSQIRSGISDTLAADAKIQEATLRSAFVQSADTSPDDFAKQRALSVSSGVPLPHLLANPDVARQHRALSDTDFSGLVAKSPLTTSFLTDPVNAGISRDDTASLSTMERVLHSANYFGGSMIAGVHDAVGAGVKLVSTVLPTTSDQDLATLYKNDPEGLKRMRETSLATSLDRFARKQTARAEKTMKGVTPEAKALFGALKYATTDTDKAAYLSPVKVISDAVRSLPTTAALLLTALLTRGAASKAAAQAVAKGMTAAEAKTAATDAAVKMASRFGAASEGSVGYAQQALQTQQQSEKTSFETLEKAPAYQELIAQGFDPAAARIYLASQAGEIAGAGAGAADAITNFFGGKFLGKILTEGGGTAARIGKGVLNEALVEGVQSPFEQWFQNAATQALTNPSQDLSAGLLESTIQGFMVGGLTGGAFAGALGRAHDEERAASGAQSISALFAAAADSLTGKRSPDTLRAALDHMAPDGSVFIDSAKLVDVLSQTGVDISALPTAAKQAAAGELAGAGIEIPISELVTGLMGTPAEKEIIKHLRMAPDLPTLGEVDEFNSTAAAFFQTEADRILEAEAKNEAFTEGAQAVHDDLFTQLTAVGRHGPQVNTSYAKLGAAFYSVLAHDLGITPVQVRDGWTDAAGTAHKGYRLKIGGEPGKAASLNQGFDHGQAMLNVGLDVGATDRAQKIDAAFVEAELNKMGVQVLSGKNVDGEYELDGQKVKELTYVPHLSRPLTEAEVNQLAAATGQEAIPQYVNGQGNLWGPNAAAWGDFNPEFFKDQAGATLASAQSGVKQIETTAFKKWFGDWQDPKAFSSRYPKDKTPVSQAVNAAGLPMTLYHATNGDFDTFETGRPSITSTTFGDIETNRHAIFVSPDSAFAEEYLRKGSGQNVMPVYLDVKAPMDLRNNKAWDYVDELNNNGFEGTRWPNLPDTRMWEMFDDETGVAFVAAAKKAGYDGAIMYESSAGDKMVEVWVAFDPTQVKSAIGNSGAFDPNDPNVLHQNFRTVSQGTIEAYRQDVAWTAEGMENGFPVWASQHVALAAPRDVTAGHDVFYMPLAGERAVKYDIRTPDGKTVGYTVLEIVDGWPVKLLDIETQKAERGNRYAEYTVAAIANDVGELAIWHIVPEARSWWDRQGTAPVDEYNGALTFAEYADARASRDNPQGVGDDVVFHQSQSTRRPTTKRAPEDHLGEVPLTVDYTKIEPEKTAQNMALVAKYPGLRFKARDAAKRAEEFIQHVTDNLLWLHDQIPADIRSRSKLWYDGARRITERWSAKYGKTDAQIAAVLAVYSPQKDWFMNVSLAERTLDIVSAQQQTPWSPEMTKVAGEILAKAEFKVLRTRIKGKTLAELTDKLDQAAWVRVYDEAHNNRGHRLVTPEGGLGEYVQSGAGKKRRNAKTGWPGFATIVKALYILEDGSAATIDNALGGEHKVRSFYNNIFHPNSDRGFVTIDTHAVAAGLLRPLSGASIEVSHNFGSAGTGQSAKTGMSGTYPYYQEAYRRAAEARGLLPRELQSITWEAVRELYTMGFKHDKAKLTALDTIWTSYEKGKPIPRIEDGKITEGTEGETDRAGDLAAVRRSILALAGGVERPAWYQRDSGLSPDGWASTYTAELLGRSAPGADGRGARSGNRGGASGSVSEVLNQSAPVVRAGVVSAPVVGVHFSRQPRAALSSGMFGTGLKGAEAERLARSNDARIKQRIAFYIDAGTGVHPEAGVGGAAHVSTLTNLYDADADTLKLFRRNQRDLNAAESAVVDAGFDGYLQRKNFHNQGTAVLLGARSQDAEHVGAVEDANARATVPPPAEIPAMKTLAIQLVNDRSLPGGAMLPSEWREYLMRLDSPLVSKIDWDVLNPNERIYKDDLAKTLWQVSETWYYSQLQRAIENASDKIFTTGAGAKQWLVANAGKLGVKKEELEFTGITDWLDMQTGKVSKADVLAYLDANGVQVQEVVKGGDVDPGRVVLRRGAEGQHEVLLDGEVYGRYTDARDASAAVDRALADANSDQTKYAQYVLPGGENYRELLLTLPDGRKPAPEQMALPKVVDRGHDENGRAVFDVVQDGDVLDTFGNWAEAIDYANEVRESENIRRNLDWQKSQPATFKSNHWDEKNILAHIRYNDRTDADGKRVLFIEEIQSDWGQKGKKEGFAKEGLPAGYSVEQKGGFSLMTPGKVWGFKHDDPVWGETVTGEYQSEEDARKAAWSHASGGARLDTPSAPFVTDTKAWVALAVKRMIAHAAENGYDKVAFVTGEQSAERYDLSKQIKAIEYERQDDGKYHVFAITNTGDSRLGDMYSESDLEDVVGKDVAQKIVAGEGESSEGNGYKTLSGLDLKVGGEGMKTFYNTIVPQVVNDVLKKVGGGRVESVAIKTRDSYDAGVIRLVRDGERWALERERNGGRVGSKTYTTYEEADTAKYAQYDAEASGATPQPGFAITPEMRASVAKGLPLFQPGQEKPKLGSFSPQTLDMRILAGADYSTFVHELGHFFLTAYADVAAQPGAPQRVVDNMAAVLKQFGIPDLATWHAMSLEEQRPYHEQLAESFEQYIFTGKAPSTELQPLFATLAAWMKRVYQSIKEFVAGHSGAKLNPELAAVFDRMLATDAEIESANAARGYAAMFASAADAGMSDKDFAAYTALTEAQREDAEAMLRTRSMRDMKWLEARRNKLIAAMQADAKEKRAEMRKEVSAEVRAEPLRQAERYLKHGVILSDSGSDIAPLGPNKLQISEVKLLFPEEALTPQPDLAKLGYGKYGMLVEVGLSPAEVAERFGLPSGIDLVNDLLGLTKLNDEIETRTDVAMLEKYGDLSSPEAMARAADEAIHNDFRTRAVATELSALAKNIGPASILMKAAKEYARQVLDTKTSRTLKPWSYAAAETRAGKAALAALRKGDRQLAATEKRTELVNHVTAKESYAVEKEIKAIVAKFKKLAAYNDASSAVKSRDFATVQAVRALLADHGIGSKGISATEYLATVKEQDPAAAARIEELVSVTGEEPKHWSEITVANLRSFAEAVDDIWFAAARTRQIEIQGKMVSQAGVAAELLATLEEQGIPARVPGEGWAPTPTEKLAMKFGALKAQWQRMEFIASKLDGNRAVGPWLKNVIGVVQDALSQMALVKASVLDQYKALLDTVSPTFVRGEIAAPELGYIFGRGPSGSGMIELLHAILHTGNESNMRKLLLGRKWATEYQDGSLDTSKWDAFVARMIAEKRITKVHYDFAQGVWNLMESLAPAAQKAHRAVFGKFFAKVTATPFENAFGKYAGGYVPALTDTDIVKDREVEKLRDAATSEMGVAFPEPPKGFTNKRVEGYTRELKLDLSALSGHINQVLLFSHMAVPVADIRRLLARPEIAGAVNRLYPGLIVEAINPWLVRVARNTVSPLATDMTRFLRAGRSRAGTNTMMGSVSNAVQQITGIIPASVAIDGTYLRHALVHNLTSPRETAEFVKTKSTYMRTRIATEAYAAADNVEQILVNPTVYQSTVDWTRRHAYFLQSAVDAALSPTIWIAAYNQALDKNPGMSDEDAIHIADSLIRKTQGATGSADIATFEAGHPFIQLFTQFTGYFNMMAQFLHGEFVKNMAAEIGLPKKYARAFYIVTVGFYAQAVAAELIAQLFRGGPGDEDKDGELIDDWLFQLGVMAPVKFLTAAVPFLGSALITAGNKWNSKPYDDKMMNSPAISALEGALGAPVDVYKALFENGKPSKAIRSVAGALGLFGLPTAILARPVGYLADVQTGHVAPTSSLDAIRGTITGTASPESKR